MHYASAVFIAFADFFLCLENKTRESLYKSYGILRRLIWHSQVKQSEKRTSGLRECAKTMTVVSFFIPNALYISKTI